MGAHEFPGRRAALIAGAVLALLGWVAPAHAVLQRQYIPIPEIILDPNEGNTYGVLGVVLFTDENEEIKYMLAPDIRYNATKGIYPNFRLYGYPSQNRRYFIQAGVATQKDMNYEASYFDRGLWDGRAQFRAWGLYEQDTTERFWGFGNDSDDDDEANYTGHDFHTQLTPTVFLIPKKLQLSYRNRIRRYGISRGLVDSEPYVSTPRRDADPTLDVRGTQGRPDRGFDSRFYWANGLILTWDTRDSIDLPTQGTYASVYGEVVDRRLGSDMSYWRFGGEARQFIPFRTVKNPILAMRALIDWTSGGNALPYWDLPYLGGRKYLRGFGGDRFIDYNRSLASVELRTKVYERKLFGVKAEVELAPFIDAGQVFRRITDSPVNDLHWVYGLGFRGLVRPQVLAFVDVGRGSEGFSIFTGVDYPF